MSSLVLESFRCSSLAPRHRPLFVLSYYSISSSFPQGVRLHAARARWTFNAAGILKNFLMSESLKNPSLSEVTYFSTIVFSYISYKNTSTISYCRTKFFYLYPQPCCMLLATLPVSLSSSGGLGLLASLSRFSPSYAPLFHRSATPFTVFPTPFLANATPPTLIPRPAPSYWIALPAPFTQAFNWDVHYHLLIRFYSITYSIRVADP
jgi:hypothetical protein